MNLNDQMLVCLEIMITGDDMTGLGNWLPALEELERRGLAARVGADFRITDEGVIYCQEEMTDPVDEIVKEYNAGKDKGDKDSASPGGEMKG